MVKKFSRNELNHILNDYLSRLKAKFKVDKAILYGSYAKGTATADSDIDLLIISSELSENKPKGANALILDRLVGLNNINPSLETIAIHPSKLSNPVTKSFYDEIFRTGIEV
jgi:predicted nucleotidyltransferase